MAQGQHHVSVKIDWDALPAAAASRWPSTPTRRTRSSTWGPPGLLDDGRMVTGCNVENASYGLALCAECGLVSALHASGGGRLVAVVTVAATASR